MSRRRLLPCVWDDAGGLTPWLCFPMRADFPDLMGRAIERRLDQAI
jgi:hypothetical protein